MPRAQEREADLTGVVEIGVETYCAPASRAQMHERRDIGILQGDEAVELEQTAFVRCSLRAGNHDFPGGRCGQLILLNAKGREGSQRVVPHFVHPDPDSIGQARGHHCELFDEMEAVSGGPSRARCEL